MCLERGTRHDVAVDRDGNAPPGDPKGFEESLHRGVPGDATGFTIDEQLEFGVGHGVVKIEGALGTGIARMLASDL